MIFYAAQQSVSDTYWRERLLAPYAVRSALEDCSREKIEEIRMENPAVGAILDHLEALPPEGKEVPFTQRQVGLMSADLQLLETSGVIRREEDNYFMPEVFRLGLGFKSRQRGRPRVLSRRAQA